MVRHYIFLYVKSKTAITLPTLENDSAPEYDSYGKLLSNQIELRPQKWLHPQKLLHPQKWLRSQISLPLK